jgi:enamine deaminase RidA (YjgF/YER057c/UK114 family)
MKFQYSNITVEVSSFDTSEGIREHHAIMHVTRPEDRFEKQLADVHSAFLYCTGMLGEEVVAVFRRYFLSDMANQQQTVRQKVLTLPRGAVSIVQQPPLDGTKVAMYVYFKSIEITEDEEDENDILEDTQSVDNQQIDVLPFTHQSEDIANDILEDDKSGTSSKNDFLRFTHAGYSPKNDFLCDTHAGHSIKNDILCDTHGRTSIKNDISNDTHGRTGIKNDFYKDVHAGTSVKNNISDDVHAGDIRKNEILRNAHVASSFIESNSSYSHVWTSSFLQTEGDTYTQTDNILNEYSDTLAMLGYNMKRNCIRTWLYVQQIDLNYPEVVKARKDFFDRNGLTAKTHYIASTGIESVHAHPNTHVQMDTYAVGGLHKNQIRYLKARTHLCPTHNYGVTFERGTVIEYGDRLHIFISGTASINNRGEIVHNGEIIAQTRRMLENIEALLMEASSTLDDVMYFIIYLRDLSDYTAVKTIFDDRFPDIPQVITLASVCRPGWLVEAECMAITTNSNSKYAAL